MWVRDALPGDLIDLLRNMRAADAEEIFLLKANKDRDQFAFLLYRMLPRAVHAVVFGLDGEPRAIGFLGLWEKSEIPGFCEVAMFARDSFPLVARDFIRHVRDRLIPFLMDAGLRRVECRALASYRASRALLLQCGAVCEARELRDFAPDGRAFSLYAWRRSDRRPPDVLCEPAEAVGAGP